MSTALESVVAQATRIEHTKCFGRVIGLTEKQISEVFGAYEEHARCTPWPLDLDRVRLAMCDRRDGREWRPWL